MAREEALRHEIRHRLDGLRRNPFGELQALPDFLSERVVMGAETILVTTYRDVEPESLRVVVQVGPERVGLFWSDVYADGFRIWPDNSIAPLDERELYEFT